jgi:hypothetical protein
LLYTFKKNNIIKNLFVFTLNRKICFPGVVTLFEIDKEDFKKLDSKKIFLCFKKENQILNSGVVARILDFEFKNEKVYLIVRGLLKGKIDFKIKNNKADILIQEDEKYIETKKIDDLINNIKKNFNVLIKKVNFIPKDIIYSFKEVKNLNILSYVLAYNLKLSSELSLIFLNESKLEKRLEFLKILSYSML